MNYATDYYSGERICCIEDNEVLNYGGIMVATFDDHYIYDRNNKVIGRLGINNEVWDEDEYDEYRIEVPSSYSDTEKAAVFLGAVLIKG